jgi:hypothetical protein
MVKTLPKRQDMVRRESIINDLISISTSTKLGTSRKRSKSGERNCHELRLRRSDIINTNSLFSRAAKHHNFGVTLCIHNVSINIKFDGR